MEMIIGGAFQGKASYAEKMYPGVRWKKGAELSAEELFCAEGVLVFTNLSAGKCRRKGIRRIWRMN